MAGSGRELMAGSARELMACATAVHVMKKSIFAFSLLRRIFSRPHRADLCCCETHNAPRTLSGPPSTRAAIVAIAMDGGVAFTASTEGSV